jgi:hypothetical protein
MIREKRNGQVTLRVGLGPRNSRNTNKTCISPNLASCSATSSLTYPCLGADIDSTSDATEMSPIICAPILHKYRPPHAIPSTASHPQPCVPRRIESTTSHYGLCPQYHRSCLSVLGRSSVHKRGAVHVIVHMPSSSGYPHERDLLCVTRRCSHFSATENLPLPGLCIRTSKPPHLQC